MALVSGKTTCMHHIGTYNDYDKLDYMVTRLAS